MTAEAKIINVEAQVRALVRGATNILNCPYCQAHNRQPDSPDTAPPMCCPDLANAVNAVMLKLETDRALDAAEVIAENAVRSASAN